MFSGSIFSLTLFMEPKDAPKMTVFNIVEMKVSFHFLFFKMGPYLVEAGGGGQLVLRF